MYNKVVKILHSFNITSIHPQAQAKAAYKQMTDKVEEYQSEIDVMAIFPAARIIMVFETKSCLNITKPDGTLNEGLDKAMKQLRKLRKFFTECHGNILSQEWRFIGAIAVPMIHTQLSTDQLNEFRRLSEDPFFLLNAT